MRWDAGREGRAPAALYAKERWTTALTWPETLPAIVEDVEEESMASATTRE